MARNKKHNPAHTRKRKSTGWRSVWPILAFGGLLLVGAIILLTRARQNQGSQETNTVGDIQVTGAPRVAVAQDKLDYGNVPLGRAITSVFTLSNIGDKDLLILGEPTVELVEGC